MLIQTISFETYENLGNGLFSFEEFIVENTVDNQNWIFTNRTRNVTFSAMFDFEFNNKKEMPEKMVKDLQWYAVIDSANELENELCNIDEMTGCYL